VSTDIDLSFRPGTYFRPQGLERYLLSKVKGAVARRSLQALFDEGRHAEVRELLTTLALSEADRKALESYHPMFMGGNYLPDTDDGEVEIARISIKSTTYDVTCVYARPEQGAIHYRVVDEYNGETLQRPTETTTEKPMTLAEFADFFLSAWRLLDVLESNFEGDREGAMDFFSASSAFYPQFDSLCRERVREHFPDDELEFEAGDRCPFCNHFNSPPADDTCEHICAWQWDGRVEALRQGQAFETALTDLAELVSAAEEASVEADMIHRAAQRNDLNARLVEAATENVDLVTALGGLADAEKGSGWSTDGMLGGSGYNIYVKDPARLVALAEECGAVIKAISGKPETSVSTDTPHRGSAPRAPSSGTGPAF